MQSERQRLIDTIREWGYVDTHFSRLSFLAGKRLLDIGMGGGPYSVVAIEDGRCAAYVGVDPAVGTAAAVDLNYVKNPNMPAYRPFPYGPADIMRLFPEVKLYANVLEDVAEEVKSFGADFAHLSSVTEHLSNLPSVFEAIWRALVPGAGLWLSHHGYHSWTGHHRYPRTVEQWDKSNPEHNLVINWNHLDPGHPCFNSRNFNRVRLEDFRLLVDKYFEIVSWEPSYYARELLTPDIRRKYSHYTIEELLTRTVVVLAIRRDKPLNRDLSGIQFFHPTVEANPVDDVSRLELAPSIPQVGRVYFYGPMLDGLVSHSHDNYHARTVLAGLVPGDQVKVSKHFDLLVFTVTDLVHHPNGEVEAKLSEGLPSAMAATGLGDWTLLEVRSRRRA